MTLWSLCAVRRQETLLFSKTQVKGLCGEHDMQQEVCCAFQEPTCYQGIESTKVLWIQVSWNALPSRTKHHAVRSLHAYNASSIITSRMVIACFFS